MWNKVLVLLILVGTVVAQLPLSLNISSLQGRWYQMHSTRTPKESFQANGFCNVVDIYNYTSFQLKIMFNVIKSQK